MVQQHTNREKENQMFRTVNAILLDAEDRLLTDAIKEKMTDGWTSFQIAKWYHIYWKKEDDRDYARIPESLYQLWNKHTG